MCLCIILVMNHIFPEKRWPHRKIKSIDKHIDMMKDEEAISSDEEKSERIRSIIGGLIKIRDEIMEKPSIIGSKTHTNSDLRIKKLLSTLRRENKVVKVVASKMRPTQIYPIITRRSFARGASHEKRLEFVNRSPYTAPVSDSSNKGTSYDELGQQQELSLSPKHSIGYIISTGSPSSGSVIIKEYIPPTPEIADESKAPVFTGYDDASKAEKHRHEVMSFFDDAM